MIPIEVMPGYAKWGRELAGILASALPIWIHGEPGTGVTTVGRELARRRNTGFLDDADTKSHDFVSCWLSKNPVGVLGAHVSPGQADTAGFRANLHEIRLPGLEDHPDSLRACIQALAESEGMQGELPDSLSALPCRGHLRGLHNRLLRWKFLGQLPEGETGKELGSAIPLDDDNLALNLHVLESYLLHRALRRSYGNRAEAARRLGISRRQLYLLVARHGDPTRDEPPVSRGPKRLEKGLIRQNSSKGTAARLDGD